MLEDAAFAENDFINIKHIAQNTYIKKYNS